MSVRMVAGGMDDHSLSIHCHSLTSKCSDGNSGVTENIKALPPTKSGFGPQAGSYKELQNHNITFAVGPLKSCPSSIRWLRGCTLRHWVVIYANNEQSRNRYD
ncbi:hypothetical protein TNCV_834941 [Trichonephila clavipes]|nr:hypothetical protein TNCV_834941 [Trichonephila clavipes]